MGKHARTRREQRAETDGEAPEVPAARGRGVPWHRRPAALAVAAVLMIGLFVGGYLLTRMGAGPGPAPAPAADGGARDAAPAVIAVAEQEPNDSTAQAQPLARLPATVTGALGAGDQDHFRFTLDEPGGHVVDAWVDGLPGARLRVRRADGTEMASVAAPGRVGALGVAKGAYLVSVEPGAVAATGSYRLTVQVSPWAKGADWEPNDDPDHQQPMAALQARDKDLARHRVRGAWSRADDVDCFTVPFQVPPEGAQLRLELQPPAGVRARLEVLDQGDKAAKIAPRTLAVATSPAAGKPAVLPALGARSWESSYAACLRAADGADPAGRYQLDARLFTPPTPFEFEPNDATATASALPLDVTVAGHLTTGDVDWFRISAGSKDAVEVTVYAPVAAAVALCDANGRELGTVSGTPGRPIVIKHGGAAFARVRATGDGDLKGTYTIVARDATGKGK